MDTTQARSIILKGRMIRSFRDYWDLGTLISASVLFVIPWYYTKEQKWSFLFLIFAGVYLITVVAVNLRVGKLHEVSAQPIFGKAKTEKELVSAGYSVSQNDENFLELNRPGLTDWNTIRLVLFWNDGRLLGYSWAEGFRFKRFPFFTGLSEIHRVRTILKEANQAGVSIPRSSASLHETL